jgi:hypothetical protein
MLLCDDGSKTDPAGGNSGGCSLLDPADTLARLRIAHLSPSVADIGVCLKSAGVAFTAADAPLPFALAYGTVSGYVNVKPGKLNLRVVPSVATGCLTAMPGVADSEVSVPLAKGEASAVLMGRQGGVGKRAIGVKTFRDVGSNFDITSARVRWLHAATQAAPELYLGVENTTGTALKSVVFGPVPYGDIDPVYGPVGYRGLDLNQTAQVWAMSDTSAGSLRWRTLAFSQGGLPGASTHTLFAIDGDDGKVDVLSCDDRAVADRNTNTNLSCRTLPRAP